ncbi:hypothetical protein QYF36_013391 [Acer negundo]|nr:hypothetical protein QYF36_013391 [Acer negundo]
MYFLHNSCVQGIYNLQRYPPGKANAGLRPLIIIITRNKEQTITAAGIFDFNQLKDFAIETCNPESEGSATLLLLVEKLEVEFTVRLLTFKPPNFSKGGLFDPESKETATLFLLVEVEFAANWRLLYT